MVNRFTQPPKFIVSNTSDDGVTIVTNALTIAYTGKGAFTASSLSIHGQIGDLSFTYAPSGNVDTDNAQSRNLFGTILGLDDMNGDISLNCSENYHHAVDEYAHPYCQWAMFGRDGYAVLDDTNATAMDGDWFSDTPNQNSQDLYFFGHGLDFKRALADYALIAGSIPMLPRYALGSLHTRWYHYSDYSFRAVAKAYASRSIPLDVAIIDVDWHSLHSVHKPWGAYS